MGQLPRQSDHGRCAVEPRPTLLPHHKHRRTIAARPARLRRRPWINNHPAAKTTCARFWRPIATHREPAAICAGRTVCWPFNSINAAFPCTKSRMLSCWPRYAASSGPPMLRRWPPCALWRTSCRSSRKYSKWKLEKSTSNTHGKNSRGYARPDAACRAHSKATPSAWDDTEKQNPAAPAVRDDALYIPTSTNAVPALDHFWRVQLGHSSLAPKGQDHKWTEMSAFCRLNKPNQSMIKGASRIGNDKRRWQRRFAGTGSSRDSSRHADFRGVIMKRTWCGVASGTFGRSPKGTRS